MERQFLNTVCLLFILVGCQQVQINPIDRSSNEDNLYSSDEIVFSNNVEYYIIEKTSRVDYFAHVAQCLMIISYNIN